MIKKSRLAVALAVAGATAAAVPSVAGAAAGGYVAAKPDPTASTGVLLLCIANDPLSPGAQRLFDQHGGQPAFVVLPSSTLGKSPCTFDSGTTDASGTATSTTTTSTTTTTTSTTTTTTSSTTTTDYVAPQSAVAPVLPTIAPLL